MTEVAVVINTTRFGDLEVDPEQVLHFPDGLIGLGGTEYVLVPTGSGPFIWLQSLSEPGVALVLTDPHRFFPRFAIELGEADSERTGIDGDQTCDVYVTVRAAAAPSECTANLKAPILVLGRADGAGGRDAHQVINQADGVQLRAPLFGDA